MDDTDRRLVYLLWEDPRMSLREISKRLGISRQSVHHRLQALERTGVFGNLRASVSADFINETLVAIWGRSESASIDDCLEKLGRSRFTWRAEVLGGGSLFIMAGLIEMSDLDGYVRFVKNAAELSEPTVGIMCYEDGINPCDQKKKGVYRDLSPLDLRIIDHLQDNARKSAVEIGREIGVSAKTVKRHLDDMTSDGSMIYNQPWDLTSGEDTCTLLYVKLKDGADKVGVSRRLLVIDPIHFNFVRSFSNIQDFLVGLVCSNRMIDVRNIVRGIAEDKDVISVTPNVIYDERMYWDQDPRHPMSSNCASRKAGEKGMRQGLKVQ